MTFYNVCLFFLFSLFSLSFAWPISGLFVHRIREVADKINKYGAQSPPALQSLKTPVKQIVIGPSHLGLLLEDGRALRVAFTVIAERLDLSKSEPNKGYVDNNMWYNVIENVKTFD